MDPVVTIAMPVFNAGDPIRLAVASLRGQTFPDWELIIVDDGSTDGAIDLLSGIRDSRIRIIRDGANLGLASRLNQCIGLARGRYLARMDQDDVAFPRRLERQVSLLEKNPAIDVVAARCLLIDENDRAVGMFPVAARHQDIVSRPWRGFHFPHPTWMGRTGWFLSHGYAQPAPYLCEDQELLMRAYPDSRFGMTDEVLFAYRVRSQPDPVKRRRTRLALWRAQTRIFSDRGQWSLVALATMALAARLGGDWLGGIFPARRGGGQAVVPDSLRGTWETVLRELRHDIQK